MDENGNYIPIASVTSALSQKETAQRALLDGPPIGSLWRHFKGGTYRITKNVCLEADLVHLVCYVSEKDGYEWARPLAEFVGIHPTHNVKRFERVG